MGDGLSRGLSKTGNRSWQPRCVRVDLIVARFCTGRGPGTPIHKISFQTPGVRSTKL